MRIIVVLCVGAILVFGVTMRLNADVDAGVKEYEFGNYKDALSQFMESAKQGDAEAQIYLGIMYRGGEGVPVDYSEAVKWYRRAAEQGHPRAQTKLAISYALGRGVEQDSQQALQWYLRAAQQGYVDAQLSLGELYSSGSGIPADYVRAYMWYTIGLFDEDTCECIRWQRDEVSEKMSPEEILLAERLVKEWTSHR